ncbi:ATP-binding protein [Streptomyces sp. NPDC048436]|uniref:ATP-binding protein n=1 Tax=Streptomyces sp. NPDC048436 TaxID=3365550 RepID=UPI00370F7D4B
MILNRGIGNDENGGEPAARQEHINGTLAPAPAPAPTPAAAPDRTTLLELNFTIADLARLRLHVSRRAEDAGLCDPRLSDFVLAVHEVASNAVVHGGGKGYLQLAHVGARLRCVVTDSGPGPDLRAPSHPGSDLGSEPGAGPASLPDCDEAENGRGLWLAEALTDHFDIAACPAGTMVTLVTLLP